MRWGPAGKTAFDDLLSDMHDTQQERYGKAVRARWPDLFRSREKAEWKQMLLALADQNIERLNAKLEVHEQNADARAQRTFAHLSFDPSPEGEALRNYLFKCTNALFRGMANYRKYQARTSGAWGTASGPGLQGTGQVTSEEAGREDHERDGSALGADDSFGSGVGQDDRLERADVIDSDGVDRCEDEVSGMGEFDENAPNEANFDGSMSVLETQGSIQVTANCGALSGLDNGATQPGEASTPEQGEALGSGSESGGAKPPTPRSSDRAVRRSLPATVSKREKRRLRREKERWAVEMMVAEKLKAGNFSLVDVLTSAMAPPPYGGRGP